MTTYSTYMRSVITIMSIQYYILHCTPMQQNYYNAIQFYNDGKFTQATTILRTVYAHDPTYSKTTSLLRLHALRTMDWDTAYQYGIRALWWHETILMGKTVYVRHDGGIGDAVQFLRYAQHLHNAGARVIIETPPALKALYALCPYLPLSVPLGTRVDADMEIVVSTPTLTYTMRNTLHNASSDVPYLFSDPERYTHWQKQLSSINTYTVGICWNSSTAYNPQTGTHIQNPRSIPLTEFSPLSELTVTLISLQCGDGVEQARGISFPVTLFPDLDQQYGRFMDTVALMQNLDLVITVDTSIAHIAGALGVPVWIIVPVCSDFRWFLDRSDTPWYPSMRIFRQKNPHNWQPVIQEIRNALAIELTTHP
jgi:hypothetical protein